MYDKEAQNEEDSGKPVFIVGVGWDRKVHIW